MNIVISILMNSIVMLSSFLFTYRLLNCKDPLDGGIAWLIVYFSQIVLIELVLGMLGLLYLKNAILASIILLLLIWLFAKRRSSNFGPPINDGEVRGLLKNKTALFLGSIIICFAIVKISINLVNPPFGWDSLNYHFTFAVEWLKHGNLDTPITPFDNPIPSYFPINGSLIFLWFMLPLKNVFLADLGQVPFFMISFFSVYSLSRKFAVNKTHSFYCAALFMLIPNFFKQLQIAYVDVMVAGLFLSGLNYLFLLEKDFSWPNAIIFSLSVGLLLGIKTLALPYSFLLILPFLFLASGKNKHNWLVVLSLIIITILGGFSYVRNLIDTANPFYPVQIQIFGKTFFRGVMSSALCRLQSVQDEFSIPRMLFHEGLGAQTLLLLIPSFFVIFPVILWKKQKVNWLKIYFYTLPLALFLIFRFIIPVSNVRYIYNLLGVGMIVAFCVVSIIKIPEYITRLIVVICGLASCLELAKRQELVASLILTVVVFFALSFSSLSGKLLELLKKRITICLFFIFVLFLLVLLERDYVQNEFIRYPKMVKYSGFWPDAARAWEWLNSHTSGNNIAYAGRPVAFPLYGSNFKNNVYYVSVNRVDPAKLHYFPYSCYKWGYDYESMHQSFEDNGNYRSGAQYSLWHRNLLRRKTDYFFAYSAHRTKKVGFPMEDKWAGENPGEFKLIYENPIIHIYKIIK